MRKHLLNAFAFVLGISFNTFIIPKKTTITFKYQLSTYSHAEVESINPTNWRPFLYINPCDASDVRACTIEVEYIYTHIDLQGRRVLNDASFPYHITISAAYISSPAICFVDPLSSLNISSVINTQ